MTMISPTAVVGTAITLLLLVSYIRKHRNQSLLPLPPGPKGLPIIGNILQFPPSKLPSSLSKWQAIYGDVLYLGLGHRSVILIGSPHDAEEIFGKRGSIYAGRHMRPTKRLIGWDWGLQNLNPGPALNETRIILRKGIGPQALPQYDDFVNEAALDILSRFDTFQGDPMEQIQECVASVVIRLAYGEKMWAEHGKELLFINSEAMRIMVRTQSQLWAMDIIEPIQHLPSWVPGASIKTMAAESRKLVDKIRYWPYEQIVKLHHDGKADNSLLARLLDDCQESENVRDAVAIIYLAGVETTSSALANFLYSVYLHPDVKRKIQEEIDHVTSQDRLPTIADRANLPYLNASWKESMRYNPAGSLAFRHIALQEDHYKGMRIPKGSSLIANIGFMMKDPRIWDDPEVFRPERFLSPSSDLPDPSSILFGFGRRSCPGKHLSDRLSWLIVASILAVYDIVPVDGESIPLTPLFGDNAISGPIGFKCAFRPRTKKLMKVLHDMR